jgi:hypothetical protein
MATGRTFCPPWYSFSLVCVEIAVSLQPIQNRTLNSLTEQNGLLTIDQAATARDRRVLAVDNFFSGLFDIPAAVMFVFIYILRWHTKEYIAEIKDKKGIEWHVITFNYFVLQVIDVPTVVLYLLLAITFYKFKRMNADLLNVRAEHFDLFLLILSDFSNKAKTNADRSSTVMHLK